MANKITFILSDESVNVYGLRILTEGIDISKLLKNPIMLYAHIRPWDGHGKEPLLPIGKWENIRKEGTKLLADGVFDEDDEFAMRVYKKVEKGILNCASIHLDVIEMSEDPAVMLPGQTAPTAVKSIAKEASIADIPGNTNCVRLSYNGVSVQLSDHEDNAQQLQKLLLTNKTETSMKSIIAYFNGIVGITLADDAKESDILTALKKVQDGHRTALAEKDSEIVKLTDQVKTYKEAATAAEEKAKSDKAIALVDNAISAGKLVAGQKEQFTKLALADYDSAKSVIDGLQAHKPIGGQLTGKDATLSLGDDSAKAAKYDELFKSNKLAALKLSDPETFKELHKAKYGVEPKLN